MIEDLKKECLVFDLETSSFHPETGEEISISDFDEYVKYAKIKWFGAYSYKFDTLYMINMMEGHSNEIRQLIAQHKTLVGFNSEAFDTPILFNNNLVPENHYPNQVDVMSVLGSSTFYRPGQLSFKDRGKLMGYKFPRNSLKAMSEVMELETQKGDIDWRIFQKTAWTDEETIAIRKYLKGDVITTKQMFDKLWDYWLPFTEFITEDDVKKLTWIKSSIASLTYQASCKTMNVECTYGEKSDNPPEKMGGNVIEPKYEEASNVWYVDFASLYPHINVMFNIPAEIIKDNLKDMLRLQCSDGEERITEETKINIDMNTITFRGSKLFHKNKLFKTKGYYDISKQHPLALDIKEKLRARMKLKKEDPDNPLIYTYKIFLNSLYGAQRSPIFEKVHTPNAGWDICWLGQQIQKYTKDRMKDFGFETIAGDTDSIFVVLNRDLNNINYKDNVGIHVNGEEQYVKSCLNTIVQEIKANVPFPCETFKIDIEQYIDYVMWPFSEQPIKGEDGKNLKNEKGRLIKERKGKKKNYVYIYNKNGEKKIKLVGLPIIKDNATKLGKKIFDEYLKDQFLNRGTAKASKYMMNKVLKEYLNKPESLALLAREFKVKPVIAYKKESQIQAQISAGYFDGHEGVISLIKNKKIGKVGKTSKYCTVEEAKEAKLTIKDLDLTKIKNELEPFVRYEK